MLNQCALLNLLVRVSVLASVSILIHGLRVGKEEKKEIIMNEKHKMMKKRRKSAKLPSKPLRGLFYLSNPVFNESYIF